LLSSIDPATLYGLYFRENDGGYGIDSDLNIIGLGPDANGDTNQVMGSLYRLNTKMSAWPDVLFRPNYLTTGSRNVGSVMSKMGWFEAGSGNYIKVIGGGDGRGVAYSSSDGLFYATEAVAASGGVDLSSYTDVASKVEVKYVGNNDYGKVNIKNTSSSSITNKWKVTFEKDGFQIQDSYVKYGLGFVDNGDTVTVYVASGLSCDISAGGTCEQAVQGRGIGSDKILATVSDAPVSGTKVGKVVNSFRVSGDTKNDYRPYRVLIVTSDLPDGYANRTAIADMVKVANDAGKGLAGGIRVDSISRTHFDDISVDLNQTYDLICTVGGLAAGSVGSAKLDAYSGRKLSLSAGSSSSISSIANEFRDNILGKKIGVDFVTVPTEYYTNFSANFQGENGWTSYKGLGSETVTGNKNYINDDSHSGKRDLDFKFKVTGTSSYNAYLYVDVDGDFKYEDDERVTLSSSNNTLNSIPLSHEKFFGEGGEDYVGGFSWKLLITSGSGSVSRIGYSAIRNETTDKNVIKILQIYPTDYKDKYKEEHFPNPLLILPTKEEITEAFSTKGLISNYGTNTADQVNTLMRYFDGILNIERCGTVLNGKPSNISNYKYKASDDADRAKIVYNASLLYYFLDQLKDYSIDVKRYSVNQFNTAVADNQVLYDAETGRLALAGAGGAGVKNLDGSDRYGYTAGQLGFTGDGWKSLNVNWTEGVFKKYLVVEGTDLIYGERGTADGSVTYYGSTKNGVSGQHVTKLDKNNEFDLVMIGFGGTLDWMSDKAVNLLKNYLVNGGPAFVGNGAVSRQTWNTFGNNSDIRNALGISNYATTDYVYYEEYTKPLITTNDTIFSHYPYTINPVMKATGDGKQPYKLKLTGTDDPVVAFSKYVYGGSAGYGKYNNAIETYYVYKKGSIVFCGFGNTTSTSEIKQQGGVLPMAETLMIVNALVASSRFGSSPAHTNPYLDCKDDDASVLEVTGMEDDQVEYNDDGDKLYYFKDSVYTDYDAYDIAAFAKDSTQTRFNTPVQNSGLGIPGKTVTETGWTSDIRWIPYLADIPTEAGGYIEFKTVNDATTLSLKVWSVADNAWVTPEGGKYKVNRNGMYYIGVPLNGGHSAYAGISKLGFMIDKNNPDNSIDMFAIRMNLYKPNKTVLLERHTISMIRRVLYHAK
jgi:hypothetical protein